MANKKKTQSDVKQSMGGKSDSVDIGGIEEAYGSISVGGDVVGRDKMAGNVVVGNNVFTVNSNYGTVISIPPSPLVDHSQAPLLGYGLWLNNIGDCEGGLADRIVERAQQTGLTHLIFRIADGPKPALEARALESFHELLVKLRQAGIEVWGAHNVRGTNPEAEASLAAELAKTFQLKGYIADIGAEWNSREKDAQTFFTRLRVELPDMPRGLSTFQYPSFQRDMPWQVCFANVGFVMPKIFWELAHNPGAQLTRSLYEYGRLTSSPPVFPLGSTYGLTNWQPTVSDLGEFIQTARDLGLNGASFYHWDWLGRSENRELWAVLQRLPWQRVEAKSASVTPPESSPAAAPAAPPPNPIREATFARRFVQIIRNDEVDKVTDRLGFDDYADTFVKLVLDENTHPPLTIGISGAWGSGKSFILKRIEDKLTAIAKADVTPRQRYQFWKSAPRPRLHVVRFNAWDYNASDAVWPGLVRGILDKLEEGAGPTKRSVIRARRNFAREIGNVRNRLIPLLVLLVGLLIAVAYVTQGNWAWVTALGLSGLYAIFKMLLDLPLAQWIDDLFTTGRSYGSVIGYMDEIRKDILALKTQLPPNAKIVVIIDDLDRCNADKIVDTLEAIKLLLNFDIFMVFLAIDSNVIARAIEKRYKEILADAGRSGYLYLDKIIQIPFRIPEPDSATLNKYLFSLLTAADRPPEGRQPEANTDLLASVLVDLYDRPYSLTGLRKFVATLPYEPLNAETAYLFGLFQKQDADEQGDKPPVPLDEKAAQTFVVWALLARWWPVTTLLMHEAMRTPDAQQIAADTSRSALFQLLDIANKRAATDMRAQKLREVADASLKMLDEAIAAAPVLTYKDLLPLLTKWKSPYPITLGFTDPELEAFQNLTAYLTNNPRHIKRLVNTYSLIRMLAAQAPNGELVVNAPEATLKWLILSSQWPLTSQAMLRAFYEELEKMSVDDVLPKDDDALARLAQKAHERIAADPGLQKQRARLDGDLGVLKKLIEGSLNVLTSAQLNLLRAYSINFNPAEGDLSPLASEKIAEASESKPQTAKADVHPE